ncbi:uncharacterized protein C7orf50 homolog [Spea bombifrons]|uniref:uncharacterized protein C7orf50 homolog n=1 Tax=Spea bombifrons TaxID=233779 RepID=UPI00234BD153|nr:uncharacterized protein C7orf50 homolog [Spea bombifrons]XP_053326604.1 uncharacterized protein C7orf50 homolog [Spea bombifrons]
MAKNKSKAEEKNKKKKLAESPAEGTPPKKKKLMPKVSDEGSDEAVSEVQTTENRDIEDLTPEERRVLERKLKKERKKEEKRLKRESAAVEEEEPNKVSAGGLSLQYLESWSKKRSEWKFQKTRQTWLLLNMYDREKVPDKYFTILLDYLGGLKGGARDTTVKKAEALIKECDKSETPEESDLHKMERIREVLQLLS